MIVSTTEHIAGMKIVKTIGVVKGNTIRARHVGRDIAAMMRGLIGGEIKEYTKLIAESREQCIDRMIEDARSKGANAIVMTRFTTSSLLSGAAELLSYGTAVFAEDE